jgi:hypothetical protein
MFPTTRWKVIAIAGWFAAFSLIGVELLRKMESRTGCSSGIDSPDGTSIAYLDSYRKIGPLVHDTNVWLDIYIQPKGISGVPDPTYLRFSCFDNDIKDEMYARDEDGAILWSPDSKTVRILLPGKEIVIKK